MVHCSRCGCSYEGIICPACGAGGGHAKWRLPRGVIAIILFIFLGFFGVHQFFLGKKKAGILFLIGFGIGLIGFAFDELAIQIIFYLPLLILWVKDFFVLIMIPFYKKLFSLSKKIRSFRI
jgi:TM2 domain-containing membrane protein YozV